MRQVGFLSFSIASIYMEISSRIDSAGCSRGRQRSPSSPFRLLPSLRRLIPVPDVDVLTAASMDDVNGPPCSWSPTGWWDRGNPGPRRITWARGTMRARLNACEGTEWLTGQRAPNPRALHIKEWRGQGSVHRDRASYLRITVSTLASCQIIEGLFSCSSYRHSHNHPPDASAPQ